jgi:hypothetical protein
MVVLLVVVVALVVLVLIMRGVVRVGVPRGMSLVMFGILGVNGLVRVVLRHSGGDLVMHLGGRIFLDGGLILRLHGNSLLGRLDRRGRLYSGFGRRIRLSVRRRWYDPWRNRFRCRNVEGFRLPRRQVLPGLVGLFRNRISVLGVLLQCAELFSGQRPGAIMIGGA